MQVFSIPVIVGFEVDIGNSPDFHIGILTQLFLSYNISVKENTDGKRKEEKN